MKSDYDKELAHRNHLPTIRQLYEDHALTAARESRVYEIYLYTLLEGEYEVSSHIKVERFLKEPRLPLDLSGALLLNESWKK